MTYVDSKQNKFYAVSTWIIKMILDKGISGLNISSVSQKSKVSRAWIYENMGRSKQELLDAAATYVSSYFSRDEYKEPNTKEEFLKQLSDGSEFVLRLAVIDPVFIHCYYRFKGSKHSLGKVINQYELKWRNAYIKSLKKFFNLGTEDCNRFVDQLFISRMGYAFLLINQNDQDSAMLQYLGANRFLINRMLITS